MHDEDPLHQEHPDSVSAGQKSEVTSAVRPTSDRDRGHRHHTPPPRPVIRFAAAVRSIPVRLILATGIACCLGFVAFVESQAARTEIARPAPSEALADRAAAATERPASRGEARATVQPSTPQTDAQKPPKKPPEKSTPRPTASTIPPIRPVAGLTAAQMANAQVIVAVGRQLKVPRQGQVIAVATALQESNLYNLASDVLPESKKYPHQGSGSDHDSVGLFQQRPSAGWGTVRDLMRPAYAAEKFYRALLAVPGWQQLSLTAAAQAVQVSAYPDAYAKHQQRAEQIVAALS